MDSVTIFAVAIWLLLGIGFIGARRRKLRQLLLRGEVVEGSVFASRQDAESNLWELTVRYVPLGSDETFEIQDIIAIGPREPAPTTGATIRVVYDRDDPTYARLVVSAM
jgi:hypothetical protein